MSKAKSAERGWAGERYCMGIDPGANCGIAVWCRVEKRLVWLRTVREPAELPGVLAELKTTYGEAGGLWANVEDSNANALTYLRHQRGTSRAQQMKISRNVGVNQGLSTMVLALLTANGIPYARHRPTAKWRKWAPDFKNDAELFMRSTRWPERGSEHARDAAMLVFGY